MSQQCLFRRGAHQPTCPQPVLLQEVSPPLAKDFWICLCWIPVVPITHSFNLSTCLQMPDLQLNLSAAFTVQSCLQTWLRFTPWSPPWILNLTGSSINPVNSLQMEYDSIINSIKLIPLNGIISSSVSLIAFLGRQLLLFIKPWMWIYYTLLVLVCVVTVINFRGA